MKSIEVRSILLLSRAFSSERRGGLSLPALLVSLGLTASGLLVGCKPSSPGEPAGGIAVEAVHDYGQNVHNSMEAGKKTACTSNLQQLRASIKMEQDGSEGKTPASLADLPSQVRTLETCPSTNQPYQYDPATGRLWCSTPGHEKL